MKVVMVWLAILSLLFIAGTANAAFPISTAGNVHVTAAHRPAKVLLAPRDKYDDDGRKGWPAIVAVVGALLAFITVAGLVVVIPAVAAGIAIVFGLVGLDKSAYKHTGLAAAALVAGILVVAALLFL